MKKQKSLRQLARELEVSPSYLSMILNGQRSCPEKFKGALYSFTNVHNTKLTLAWKAGTLPAELLPQSKGYFKPDVSVCQSRVYIYKDLGKGGFEPPRLAAHDPKSCSSASSDTSPKWIKGKDNSDLYYIITTKVSQYYLLMSPINFTLL